MSDYEAFDRRDVEIDGWQVHYVDTGAGSPVVLVHGSPISSYAFRQQIAALSSRFRVIAPDLLGFGSSEGPEEGASFQQQADMLCALLDHLSLGAFRLVVHDWGGPIGVGCAARRPEQIQQLVLINTTLLADFEPPFYWRPFTMRGVGELLLVRMNVFSRGLPTLMRSAREREVRQAYARPLKEVGLRSNELQRLEKVFPGATVHKRAGAGHFPQEDAPEAVTAALLDFLE
jgi:pimeloyl-ACP methyl ester carboxylesterase